MHVDENKRYDKRGIERSIREGLISQKEFDEYLASLPDVSNKIFVREQHKNRRRSKEPKMTKDDVADIQQIGVLNTNIAEEAVCQ